MVFNWLLIGNYLEISWRRVALEVVDRGVDAFLHLLGHGGHRQLLAYEVLLPACCKRQLEARWGRLDRSSVEVAASDRRQDVVIFAVENKIQIIGFQLVPNCYLGGNR